MNVQKSQTLWWEPDAEDGYLALLDQTRLPQAEIVRACHTADEVAEAIATLRVRGAPAIGVAAAYGVALGARSITSADDPLSSLRQIGDRLRATRPTAVNLAWAVEGALVVAEQFLATGAAVDLPAVLLDHAHAVWEADIVACEAMGRLGAILIPDGATLLTHCNAGALATAGIGSALAPIYVAHAEGRRIHVFVDETRPVLQGARLTAWELQRSGVPCTLITDNMAAYQMRHGGIQAVFVGADRIAANGDVANKIGTYGLAILAHYHQIPFYVVAPTSTIDLRTPTGDGILIEQRAASEVTEIAGKRIAPEGISVANPAFDSTPASLITAIVTERDILYPPYANALHVASPVQSGRKGDV